MEKNAIFGLDDQDYKGSKIVVIPIAYDMLTPKDGCRGGPTAILEASRKLERYDSDVGFDVADLDIFTSPQIDGDGLSPEAMIKKISAEVSSVLEDKKIPLLLGGDHITSLGGISAFAEAKAKFDVIQFDAHSGTRYAFNGSQYAHECSAARIREMASCYTIDVRSGDIEGMKAFKADILTITEMKEIGLDTAVKRMVRKTGSALYVSFNFDFMRLSDMPSVRTPEPGGLSYGKTLQMLSQLMTNKSIVGIDFVGFAPISGFASSNVTAAKLIQNTLCYMFKEEE